jgi:hypothetical protein
LLSFFSFLFIADSVRSFAQEKKERKKTIEEKKGPNE